MYKKISSMGIMLLCLFLLSGCLYPQGELAKNQIPNEMQIETVQKAIDKYREDTGGLVPIRTKDSDVPIYEKYVIDFAELKDNHYIDDIPGTSFENGGLFQYVLVDPETTAEVKLIDLRVTDKLREINRKMDTFRTKEGYPPFGTRLAKDIYQLDYKQLGYTTEPVVVSPFTQNNLPLILNAKGELFVDYRMDLFELYGSYEGDIAEGEDIRHILVDHHYFVPAYSLPYEWAEDEPQFLIEE